MRSLSQAYLGGPSHTLFLQATPELELDSLNIGSRPTKRNPEGGIESCDPDGDDATTPLDKQSSLIVSISGIAQGMKNSG